MENESKEVWVVTIENRRFFDECQHSYLPEMKKVFGVYSTKEKAFAEVWDYFMGRYAVEHEVFLDNYDINGEYIGCELVFKRADKKYGGHALYGVDFHLETIDV